MLGATAFKFLVPALAGYIAYAIADRPGIAPGFVMGALAVDLGGFGLPQSGFLGGIIGGVMAGFVALWISRWKVPPWARGLMPVLLIPLLATLISGFVMIAVLSKPLGKLMEALTDGLNSMSDDPGLAILLGVILGLMMAFDMGGPLNKVAYAFATAGLGAAATASGDAPELKVMAAVMLAGMVPPLALALATVVRPGLFSVPERENGKAAWALGASFITEGAIPFAAADPLRVIPSIMLGSAVTGGLAMAMDVTLRAPHGGIFVLFAVGNVIGFLIALVAGVLVARARRDRPEVHRRPRHRPGHRLTVPVHHHHQGETCPARPSSSAPPSACTPDPPPSSPRPPASSTARCSSGSPVTSPSTPAPPC